MKSHVKEKLEAHKKESGYDMIHSYNVLSFINNARSLDSGYSQDISTGRWYKLDFQDADQILLIRLHPGYTAVLNLY